MVSKVLLYAIVIIVTLMANMETARAASYLRNETDRLALLNIKLRISDDPQGVLNSWNDSHHHCYWEGVICDVRHQRVTNLTLIGKTLVGSISSHIGNLSFLQSINLEDNMFHGEIPAEIGRLFRLRGLNLSSNGLSGKIPVNLSRCSKLRSISILNNRLTGKIPPEFGSLKKLVFLRLKENNLIKGIPSSFGNLSLLGDLSLSYNNLEGSLPNEIGALRNLWRISVGANKLSGVIPPSIYNISTLSSVTLAVNFLEGELPNDIGLKMPNLRFFGIGGNQFRGKIPDSITNETNLEILDLSMNKFEGNVPSTLGYLRSLRILNVEGNFLGHNTNGDLDFVTSLTNCSNLQTLTLTDNNFGGQLPHSIGNLSLQVMKIYAARNKISGTIPVSLARLANLYLLALSNNFLTATIPQEFVKLQNLQVLYLFNNMLIGEIPSTLCNLTSLFEIFLGGNNLEGTLPPCFGNSPSLKTLNVSGNKLSGLISPALFGNSFALAKLDLSHNLFTGPLPHEVGRLANIILFDVSYNNFSGQIPGSLGDCSYLQSLRMQSNFFGGIIPPLLASLKEIEYLDLSQNNLTGQIPKVLERLRNLNYLNLPFNDLQGDVPMNSVFGNSSQVILVGNIKLCGGIPELRLPSCPVYRKKNSKLLIIVGVSSLFALIVISILLFCCYPRRSNRENDYSREDKFLRVSYHEIHRATGGFSQENIVDSGSFGVVYKGRLDNQGGKLVAVKVLDLQKKGVSKSFKAECDSLRNTRHRNLVPLLSYCSSIDSEGNNFKALIYDFMENGNLDMWLHPRTTSEKEEGQRSLSLVQRLNIAIDVASALQYLHHYCEFIIAHCDLKPNNILLDNDFTAHVGDFGLARILPKTFQSSSTDGTSSSIGVKGTIGYVPPEYGMGCEATIEGDAYSYGILLLEIFTGKRPTDENFTSDLNLRNYVEQSLQEGVQEILDPLLGSSRQGDEEIKCIISILKIGLRCSESSPKHRMDMNEVTRQLQAIRDAFLRGQRI